MILTKTIFFSLVFLTLFSILILGQSVVIVPETITYTRPNPISIFKKTFTITYPKVKNISPALAKKIEGSISYQKVLSFNLEDEMNEYQWLEEGEYQVGFNDKGILSIYLSFTGTTAHQTFIGKSVVVDLKTGNQLPVKDVFTNLNSLINKLRKIQKEEIAVSIEEIKKERDYGEINTTELFKFAKFQNIHLDDFSVGKDGVTFHYDYSFPYYLRTLEPSGNYFLSWKDLKPFIKRNSLLHKFIK